MTTGRINQVAFLGDTTTHTTPDADETRGETGEEVVFIEHEQLEMGGRRGGGPRAGITFGIRKHERSHVGQFGGSPLDWNTGAAARLAPRPRGGARLRGTASHSNSTEVGTQHRNPASPQGTQGLGLRVMGAASRQFGAPTRSLPTRTARLPLMRLCVHATTIPTRWCPHRWTRRISKGQATGRGGDTMGTIMRGAVCPSSEDGGQASAAGTSRHEVEDGEERQHMGARTTI